MKAQDVLREKHNTVLLGTSRIDLGLDAQDPAWPSEDRPVYNLALGSGSPYENYRYLQHISAVQPPKLVIVGLDFEQFLLWSGRHHPDVESYLSVASDGSSRLGTKWEKVRTVMGATLSMNALRDTLFTLAGNLSGSTSDMEAGTVESAALPKLSHISSLSVFASDDLAVINTFRTLQPTIDMNAMQDLRRIVELCQAGDIRLILLINPVHAHVLEIISLTGRWTAFEEWKRALVRLAIGYTRSGVDKKISIWDFTDYDSYSTESVARNLCGLRWFWEPDHYKSSLGTLIIRRITGMGSDTFGARLTGDSLETHLQKIRLDRRRYREVITEDIEKLRSMLAAK